MSFTQSIQSSGVVSVPAQSDVISLHEELPIKIHAYLEYYLPDAVNSKLNQVMYARTDIKL